MTVEILAIGTELLLGNIANTDAQFISRQLAGMGIGVYGHTVVGDNRRRLHAAFAHAFTKADMVIAVGGLGPTDDDITKAVAAQFFARDMVLDAAAFARIETRFAATGLPENVHKNALVPAGAQTLPNDHGSAPGVWLEQDGKTLLLLPGPPHELEPMFVNYAVPLLREKSGGQIFFSRTLKFIGMGESNIEGQLKDLFDAQENPTLALYAKVWECHLRLTAAASTEAAARDMIEPTAQEIYARLGAYIYGEGDADLPTLAVAAVRARGETLAVAESCTGGMVASLLVGVSGVSAILNEAIVTYSNEAKTTRLGVDAAIIAQHGAVSAECAAAMAEGVARTAGAGMGLSTTGIAGPDGGTPEKPVGTVFIGLCINGTTQVKKLQLAGERNTIRERAAMAALNLLRRALS